MSSNKIEDAYPLSPMQQGILFHSVYSLTSRLYVMQESYELRGNLDVAAFTQAWQQVVDQHPILRTAFVWENLETPIQIVGKHIKLPLEKQDWRGISAREQQKQLQAFLEIDKQQGFHLAKAPLMRLNLIQLSEDTFQFIWSHHHLVLDGWSLSLILKEVIKYYQAYLQGDRLQWQNSRPYRDYIAWLQQQDTSQAENFWRQYLHDFSAPTPLMVDRHAHNLSIPEENYAQQHLQLSTATKAALQSFARQHHLTLNTIVQGLWAVLLSRYSREQDVVFGCTSSGRPLALRGAESMIGVFINTLPLRVQVNPEDFLIPWLQQLQAQHMESLQYDYTPLMAIQGWSGVPRGLSLFDSILVSQDYQVDSSPESENGNLHIRRVDSVIPTTNYPLTVLMGTRSVFYVSISYLCQRYDAATIARMLGHLQTLLEAIVTNSNQRLKDLSLLTATERHLSLVTWNNTQTPHPQNLCLHQLFEAQVEKTPNALAVVFADQKLTYRELNYRANQLAHHLQNLGVEPETLVGICVERSLEMVVGLLGILKASGAYVPLDPAYPQERLAFMLADANVKVLLTQKHLQDLLPQTEAQIVCLDQNWEIIAQHSSDTPNCKAQPDNLAYVIYTSGSTGQPKGVMISHRAICNHTLWMQAEFPFTASDRVLQKTPFSFDASVWEFYAPLLAGGQLILAKPGGHQDSAYLLDLIAQQQVSIVQLVPSQLRMLLEEQKIHSCHSLHRVFCGGEALTIDLQQRFFSILPKVELCNLYGPTEATIDTAFWRCQPLDEQQSVPIGKAIANAQIFLLDSNLQLVPVGVSGEIYIGGAGLARGYLNQPELTAQKFIVNPFTDDTQLYKTGDLGRYRPDGTVEFLGRIDNQVKLRGFRIELAEVETQLSHHPGVRQNVVVVREDFPSQQRLVAYIVSRQHHSPTVTELRSFLKQTLPDYMVPSVFITLSALPLLPNGKIDHKSLPIPDTNRPELAGDFVAPRNFIEENLVQIWGEVLRIENISIYDNFFELGGDSILSLQVIAKANQAALQLTPKQIFEHQTIAELARVVNTTTVLQAEQGMVTGSLPLTPIQHWFFEQALPEPHHWNQAVMLEVPQMSDPSLWEQVVQKLLEHHDALRLRFVQTVSGWQSNHAAVEQTVPFLVKDLSDLPENQQRQAIEATATSLQTSLNLSTGPLIRVVLFQLGTQQPSRLLTIIHHLVVDGVSWRILLEDLQTAYLQLSQGQKIKLPTKTTSLKQWAEKLREYAQSPLVKSELDYWLSQSHEQIFPLTIDFSNGENTEVSAATVSVALTPQETQALLQEVPSAYQTQINDVLLTALVQAFYQWTGKNSLLVDLEGHGREDIIDNIDLSRTVGWFTTIFPVVFDLEPGVDLGEALKTIKEQLRIIPNRGINYGILRYLSHDQQLQSLPQAEVKFNYLGQFDQVLSESSIFRPAQESAGRMQSQQGKRNCLLEVNGLIVGGQLRLDWTYSKALHQKATIEKLAQGFMEALRSLIIHCQSPNTGGYTPSDFPRMKFSQQELDQLMAELG